MKKIITMTLFSLVASLSLQAQITEEPTEAVIVQEVLPSVDFDLSFVEAEWEEPEFDPTYDFNKATLDISKLKNGRALDEINMLNNVDAYPWVSADGLRVYFTQNMDERDQIVMASRTSVDQPFNAPTPQSFNIPDYNNMSCWLSADELTVFFTVSHDGYQLYSATRQSKSEEFNSPVLIDFGGHDVGFISAPSLTQDGEQLFLYANNGETEILQFNRIAEHSYSLVAPIDFPSEVVGVTPGELSKDGLKYYGLSKNAQSIHVMSRNDINEAFSFESNIEVGSNFHQLSIANDWMVLTYSPDNSWGTNDLFIAESPFKNAPTESPVTIEKIAKPTVDVEIFPNPGAFFVNVRFELPESNTEALLEIFDATGKIIKTQNINGNGLQTLQVDVSDMSSGSYFCRLIGNGFDAKVKVLVVK